MTDNKSSLLPCPFCGSERLAVKHSGRWGYFVACKCHAVGPNFTSRDGKRFESVGQASMSVYGALGFESNIKRAIKTGGRAGGYHWSYEEADS